MKNNNNSRLLKLNAGSGMAIGVLVGAIVALLINLFTGNSFIWSWAIPVGLACGLAIGAGASNRQNQQ